VLEPFVDSGKRSNDGYLYRCKCECGNIVVANSKSFCYGATSSCGCLQREAARIVMENVQRMFTENNYVEGTSIIRISSTGLQKNNTSGVRGVTWSKCTNKWVAYITFKRKKYYLGSFSNINDAAKTRKEARDRIYGEFLEWYYSSKH